MGILGEYNEIAKMANVPELNEYEVCAYCEKAVLRSEAEGIDEFPDLYFHTFQEALDYVYEKEHEDFDWDDEWKRQSGYEELREGE